jgi:hypothetical protein
MADDNQKENELTELENTQVDLILSRVRIVQLEVQVANTQIESERAVLEAKLRARLNPPSDYVFNWRTKVFGPPETTS